MVLWHEQPLTTVIVPESSMDCGHTLRLDTQPIHGRREYGYPSQEDVAKESRAVPGMDIDVRNGDIENHSLTRSARIAYHQHHMTLRN